MTLRPLTLSALTALTALNVLCASAARADELAEPVLTRQRGLTILAVEGRSPGEPGPLVLELTRAEGGGEGAALAGRARRGAGGLVRGSLSTRRALLPGRYQLLLREGERVRAQREVLLGSDDDQARSREGEARWLSEAARTARGLCTGLERTARFLFALGLAPAERSARIQGFMAGWRHQLRRARADLALFERRVVLPHRPAAIVALGQVHAALAARGRAWEAALSAAGPESGSGSGAPPGDDAEVQAAARALSEAAGLSDPPEAWLPGPLAVPPPWDRIQAGSPYRADGFELAIPAGWVVAGAPSRPELRLHLRPEASQSVVLTVSVGEAPELTDLAGLEAMHETSNWESFSGYARPQLSRPAEGGLVVRFQYDPAGPRAPADAERPPVQVAQRVLFQPARGRTYVLAVSWSGTAEPAGLEALLGGFRLAEGE